MGLEIISLIGEFPLLPGPLERSSTVIYYLQATSGRAQEQDLLRKYQQTAGITLCS